MAILRGEASSNSSICLFIFGSTMFLAAQGLLMPNAFSIEGVRSDHKLLRTCLLTSCAVVPTSRQGMLPSYIPLHSPTKEIVYLELSIPNASDSIQGSVSDSEGLKSNISCV